MAELDYTTLKDAVAGNAVAIRAVTRLQPAGGKGDKIFPPTYQKEGRADTKYALETRWIDGQEVKTVLIDSVASQANRMEEALLEAWRREELRLPVIQVDFSGEEGLRDLEQITSLQAPHRIADALLRDSLLDGTLFRLSTVGRAFTDARPNHATSVYQYCPTALLFGVWDSTGPKGGLGAKFQRCLVSEIVGINAVPGVKVSSRIDPAGIQTKAGEIYKHKDSDEEWTSDPAEAELVRGKPVLFSRTGKKDAGTPGGINHGNIPPQMDFDAGGVTMSYALHTTVLSFAGLRRLRFTTKTDGTAFPSRADRDAAELAARTTLAALGLAAIVHQREMGYDLRSRSLLVPEEPFRLEFLSRDGSAPSISHLEREAAGNLLGKAEAQAREHGLAWHVDPITLRPTPKLAQLIRQSRAVAIIEDEEGGD